MGNGIAESDLAGAAEEGANAGRLAAANARPVPPEPDLLSTDVVKLSKEKLWTPLLRVLGQESQQRERSRPQVRSQNQTPAVDAISPRITPVYEKPDGWSNVLCQLPDNAAVTVLGTDGNFLKVSTATQIVGYISQSARDHLNTSGQ
jgi:hypothetical protein